MASYTRAALLRPLRRSDANQQHRLRAGDFVGRGFHQLIGHVRERLPHPRIVPFLLEVHVDGREPTPVRNHVLKQLRNGQLGNRHWPAVGKAMLDVLADRSSPDLRLQAALALAEFTDLEGVLTTLGRLTLDAAEPIDLRYSAFTSLQQAGPARECVGSSASS